MSGPTNKFLASFNSCFNNELNELIINGKVSEPSPYEICNLDIKHLTYIGHNAFNRKLFSLLTHENITNTVEYSLY